MHKLYYVGFAVDIALNTFSMGAPVDRIEDLLSPLVAFSEVLFLRFRRRLISDSFLILACHCSGRED